MIGQSVGSDANPLSCFLFRPRKSCEKRRKRSHTNVSNTLVTRPSTPPAQTAHVCFRGRKWAHTRLCSKDRTQRLTRRNGECFGWDAIITLDTSCTFTNIPGPGVRTANFAAFGSWSGGALEERREPSGQRCAYACRCPEGVAAPLGCVIFLLLSKLRLVCPVPDTSFGSPDAPACAVPVQAASQLVPFRLGVQWFSVETGRIFCYNF